MLESLCWLFSDNLWFPLIQTALLALFAWAMFRPTYLKRRAHKSGFCAEATVKRGENSWRAFVFAWGVLSLIAQQIIRTSTSGIGYKVLLNALDLSILAYLCFYNDWFRNQLVRIVSAAQEKEER